MKSDDSVPNKLIDTNISSVFHNGVRLGPVGGRIVAETILGMLQLDPREPQRPDAGPAKSC